MNEIPPFAAHHRASDGKWQTLESHLLGVADLASQFAAKLQLSKQGELLGLMHDLGKYSDQFQYYLKSATGALNQDEDEEWVDSEKLKGKIDHSTAGAQLVWQKLSDQNQLGHIVGQILALCIASHHSGLINCLTADSTSTGEDAFTKRTSKAKTHSK